MPLSSMRQGILENAHQFFFSSALLNIQKHIQILSWDIEIVGEILLLKDFTSTSDVCKVSFKKNISSIYFVEFGFSWFSIGGRKIAKVFLLAVCHLVSSLHISRHILHVARYSQSCGGGREHWQLPGRLLCWTAGCRCIDRRSPTGFKACIISAVIQYPIQ